MREQIIGKEISITPSLKLARLDKRNIIVLKKQEVTKRETGEKYFDWKIEGYHGDIVNAFKQVQDEILKDGLFQNELKNIEEIKKTILDLKKQIVDIVEKPTFDI